MKVLCVTPNVAVDRILRVPAFCDGGVWRAAEVLTACGGKGINVGRALLRLKAQPICAGILAGHGGRLAAVLAEAERLPAHWTWVEGETRTSMIVVGDHGRTTVVNEPGPKIDADGWARFVADVAALATAAETVCISGSLPPGCPRQGLTALIAAASGDGRPVWVDTSGPALAEAIAAVPFGIKVNAEEAAVLLGRPVASPVAAASAAALIRARGVDEVAITLGEQGGVLVNAAGTWHAMPPPIRTVSAVGSGDCFLAGLLAGRKDDRSGEASIAGLRLAVACGAANAQDIAVAPPTLGTLETCLAAVIVRSFGN